MNPAIDVAALATVAVCAVLLAALVLIEHDCAEIWDAAVTFTLLALAAVASLADAGAHRAGPKTRSPREWLRSLRKHTQRGGGRQDARPTPLPPRPARPVGQF